MKKQFLKSAAILSLAVTAVSTSQPVGAIMRNNPEIGLPDYANFKSEKKYLSTIFQ